mmetsp:Transcript_58444/g.107894  ORF Transcript_58444/g.107894 Transcript_58444/m.107894 type:complete len:353 (+) Transcript_58444:166-1224(+)
MHDLAGWTLRKAQTFCTLHPIWKSGNPQRRLRSPTVTSPVVALTLFTTRSIGLSALPRGSAAAASRWRMIAGTSQPISTLTIPPCCFKSTGLVVSRKPVTAEPSIRSFVWFLYSGRWPSRASQSCAITDMRRDPLSSLSTCNDSNSSPHFTRLMYLTGTMSLTLHCCQAFPRLAHTPPSLIRSTVAFTKSPSFSSNCFSGGGNTGSNRILPLRLFTSVIRQPSKTISNPLEASRYVPLYALVRSMLIEGGFTSAVDPDEVLPSTLTLNLPPGRSTLFSFNPFKSTSMPSAKFRDAGKVRFTLHRSGTLRVVDRCSSSEPLMRSSMLAPWLSTTRCLSSSMSLMTNCSSMSPG